MQCMIHVDVDEVLDELSDEELLEAVRDRKLKLDGDPVDLLDQICEAFLKRDQTHFDVAVMRLRTLFGVEPLPLKRMRIA